MVGVFQRFSSSRSLCGRAGEVRFIALRISWNARRGKPELSEMNVRARAVFRAAVPHGAKIAGRNLDQRGIGIVDAGVVECLLLAPRAAGVGLEFVAERHPATGRGRGGAVVVNIEMRAIRGAAVEGFRFGVPELGLLFR